MIKFFRVCGVIVFVAAVPGFYSMLTALGGNSIFDIIVGALLTFFAIACGLLFIYAADLLERVRALEKKVGINNSQGDANK